MAPIGVGIIGLSAGQSAWATTAHAAPLKSAPLNEKFKLVALATSSPETAKKAAEAHGVEAHKAYSTAEAIADDKDVDLVVVSVKVCPLHFLRFLGRKDGKLVEWTATGPLGLALFAASTHVRGMSQPGCEPTKWLIPTSTK